ncbi:uncharacterized protein CCR75_002649 [Bremia lactucae]|uniref:Uncharacterized protein n=1 Tax=Bremia lactucae TaxID=4779 RepID=A0A976FGR0_BRELC|nr:hypothetical protein CCR75_002649 [Bremia lactucae]
MNDSRQDYRQFIESHPRYPPKAEDRHAGIAQHAMSQVNHGVLAYYLAFRKAVTLETLAQQM